MKKQENDSLIQELTKRLDWYMMEASDEEFDADQVQALMKLLDSLKTEDNADNVEEELPVEEAVSDFWKYCGEREEEDRLLRDEEPPSGKKEKGREEKGHKVLGFVHRHRAAVIAAAVLVVILLGGSWQAVANAEKHGGFFWWMDKDEEGTMMITSPEGVEEDVDNRKRETYYSIEKIPEEYRSYVEQVCEIQKIAGYSFSFAQVGKGEYKDKIYIFMQKDNDVIRFEIIIYPQQILRTREIYPEYTFEREFEDGGILFDVLSKKEASGDIAYLMYFYCGKEKYSVWADGNEDDLQEIVVEYKNIILGYYEN